MRHVEPLYGESVDPEASALASARAIARALSLAGAEAAEPLACGPFLCDPAAGRLSWEGDAGSVTVWSAGGGLDDSALRWCLDPGFEDPRRAGEELAGLAESASTACVAASLRARLG